VDEIADRMRTFLKREVQHFPLAAD
jgi:hypothetical protein